MWYKKNNNYFIISFFIPHHTKKKTLFANTVFETLIRSVQISDIAVINLVAEEKPTLSTIKSQLKKMTYRCSKRKANYKWKLVLKIKHNNFVRIK